jgi:hypothetical protein
VSGAIKTIIITFVSRAIKRAPTPLTLSQPSLLTLLSESLIQARASFSSSPITSFVFVNLKDSSPSKTASHCLGGSKLVVQLQKVCIVLLVMVLIVKSRV